MNDEDIRIVPYGAIVGQAELKLALEIAYVSNSIHGVLLSGDRGTGKSTTVRAFSRLVHDALPVTIPINVTEDRVIGGWNIPSLLAGDAVWQDGLLEEAHRKAGGILYIDEVNLLDDHIVNILLDVTATGILEVERDGQDKRQHLNISLIGTMNPEEGGLRPQLLDRFGLMVHVRTEREHRREVLQQVLRFDKMRASPRAASDWLQQIREQDERLRSRLKRAREKMPEITDEVQGLAVELANRLETDGHRGELVLAKAAQACAALRGQERISREDLRDVAPLALQHRVPGASSGNVGFWGTDQTATVLAVLDLQS